MAPDRRRGQKRGRGAQPHRPVLPAAVLAALKPRPGRCLLDATVGAGGHAWAVGKRLAPGGTVLGLDVDPAALELAEAKLAGLADVDVQLLGGNFRDLPDALARAGRATADLILADLGVSSMQIDDAGRGISYRADGPLDMRMDPRLERTAADILAEISEQELSRALWELADEPDHERIARWVVNQRAAAPIDRVEPLCRLVLDAKGARRRGPKPKWNPYGSQHPAARTFQALRMLVNREAEALEAFLSALPDCLAAGGRAAVISFHSGEDRLVKRALAAGLEAGVYAATAPKPIQPDARERRANPRSASAKLRWAVRAG